MAWVYQYAAFFNDGTSGIRFDRDGWQELIGKVTPRQTSDSIDTKGVQVDGYGDVVVPPSMVIKEAEARFGDKVYADIAGTVQQAVEKSTQNLTSTAATAFTQNVQDTVKELAKGNAVTMTQAEQVVKQKVFISKANGAALKNGTIVGTPYVADKEVGATETFLTVGGFDEKGERKIWQSTSRQNLLASC